MAKKNTEQANIEVIVNGQRANSSIKEMEASARAMRAQWRGMATDSKEFKEMGSRISEMDDKIKKAKSSAQETGNVFSKTWGGLTGTFGKLIPVVGAAFGAIKSGEAIINSAQVAADEWEKALSGAREGLNFLMKSVASMDFSNFFTNLREAVKAGREYAEVLDDLGDRNRALGIQEADAKRYILERTRILRDATKTEAERIKAADEVIAKEDELAAKRTKNAKIAYDAEVKLRLQQSGLNKEELENYLRNYDQLGENIKKGESYNEVLRVSKINGVTAFLDPAAAALKASGMVDIARENIKAATEDQKKWGQIVKGVGKLNDEELNKLVDLYKNVQDADVSALENTQKVATRRSALLANVEKQDQKALKNTTEFKKQAIKEAFDFEAFALEMSSKDIDTWAKDAEKLYKEVYDMAVKSTEELADSPILKPDDSLQKKMVEDKKKLDETLDANKPDNVKTKISSLNADLDNLEKNKGLIKEDEYQTAINNIKLKKATEYAKAAQTIAGALGDFVNAQQDAELSKLETNKQKELKAAGDNAELKKQIEEKYGREEIKIKKKFADKQFIAQTAQIVVAGALAVMQAFAQLGPIGGAIAAVLIGATTVLQVSKANEERKRIQQLATGRYNVIGADDNRSYSVPYAGPMQTGMYTRPVLVAEHGNELVMDKPTVDNIRMREPSLLTRMLSYRVPQRADGNYTSTDARSSVSETPNTPDTSAALLQFLADNRALLSQLVTILPNLKTKFVMDEFKQAESQYELMQYDKTKR